MILQEPNMAMKCDFCGTSTSCGPVEYNWNGFRLLFYVCQTCVAVINFEARREIIKIIKELREKHVKEFQNAANTNTEDQTGESGDSEAASESDIGEPEEGRGEDNPSDGPSGVRADDN